MKLFDRIKMGIRACKYKYLKKDYPSISISARIGENVVLEGANSVGADAYIRNTMVGYGTYISDRCYLPQCKIGKYCSIARDVKRISGTHPSRDFVSTYPGFFSLNHPYAKPYVSTGKFDEYKYAEDNCAIVIGNDVWIGQDVRILDGVSIGDGAIIAAGAIVTRDVEPYSIVGGVPAKLIRYRFSDKQREQLLQIKWWNRSQEWIQAYAEAFENIEEFMRCMAENREIE